jgi:[FeFe] hydrogenase H-cluster maturation GTPase HydF
MNPDTNAPAVSPTAAAPRGMRPHIGLFGRRNVGKSSLYNRLLRQDAAIVSDEAGTTTDPVERMAELHGVGAVQVIDTAGIDDVGALGEARVERTRRTIGRVDVALLVVDAWEEFERDLLGRFRDRGTPVVVVCTKADVRANRRLEDAALADGAPSIVRFSALSGEGFDEVLQAISAALGPSQAAGAPPALAGDLVPPGGVAVLVTPIDQGAPQGRLILPQVQTIRDLLDHGCLPLVVRDTELADALASLRAPPAMVITDSQAFRRVAACVPGTIPLTSFSIRFARLKGDLALLAAGAARIERLRPGDRILIAEACTHHPIQDDIGTVKIPRLLEGKAGGALCIHHAAGRDFPEDASSFDLVVHCGSCMLNRTETLSRLGKAAASGVPVTNYGMAIAACLGILDRALAPFPEAREAWLRAKEERA